MLKKDEKALPSKVFWSSRTCEISLCFSSSSSGFSSESRSKKTLYYIYVHVTNSLSVSV